MLLYAPITENLYTSLCNDQWRRLQHAKWNRKRNAKWNRSQEFFKKVNTHKREVQLYKASSSFLSTTELPFLHHPISSYTTSHASSPTQSLPNCKKAKTKNTTSQLHKAHQLIFHKLSSTKQTQEASCSRAIWMGCLPTLLITRRICRWTHPHPYHTPYACVLSSRARKNKLLLETQGVK